MAARQNNEWTEAAMTAFGWQWVRVIGLADYMARRGSQYILVQATL